MSMLPTNVVPASYIKAAIPVGAGFDVLNGEYYRGKYGEMILSGGFSYIMGFAGRGNNYKSTLAEWFIYTGMGRMMGSTGLFYDTETNKKETRMKVLQRHIRDLVDKDLFASGRFVLTDNIQYSGNKYFEMFKDWMKAKFADKKNWLESPFIDRDGESLYKMLQPTFGAIDSFTEFMTDDIDTARDKSELGGKEQNIINMRGGLVKTNLMQELPKITVSGNNYMVLVAQVGKKINVATGHSNAPPAKQLQHMPEDDDMKGVTSKFTFATHDCWLCHGTKFLTEKTAPYGPLFPRDKDDTEKDTDLMLIKLLQLRSKNGQSGLKHEVIVSQTMGIQPELTEYYYLKERQSYGFEGNNTTFALSLFPSVKIMRTTIRQLIEEHAHLRRALTITIELKQMDEHWHHLDDKDILTDPKTLYDDLKAMGYDWDILLNTRGWWTLGEHPIPYLSTMDLLNMRKQVYHPYWYSKVAGKEKEAAVITTAPRHN